MNKVIRSKNLVYNFTTKVERRSGQSSCIYPDSHSKYYCARTLWIFLKDPTFVLKCIDTLPVEEMHNEKVIQLLISEGDERAFTALFNHYYPLLHPLVAGYALTEADIEEVLQETFIRVWIYRDKLPEIECLRKWIFRVASRECLSILRKNLEKQKRLSIIQKNTISFYDETPEERLYLSEISRLVQQAVDKMPPRRRQIYQMSRAEGMQPAEIARTLSLSVSTVKNVLSGAVKYIREYLISYGISLLLVSIFLHII